MPARPGRTPHKRTARTAWAAAALLAAAWALLPVSLAQGPGPLRPTLIDAVAAVVDGEIITLSDVRVRAALDLDRLPGTSADLFQAMIDERVMYNEASRIPVVKVSPQDVDQALERFRGRHEPPEKWRQLLASLDLAEGELRDMLRRRLLVQAYVDYRFRPFIMVEPIEVDEALHRSMREGMALDPGARRQEDLVREGLERDKLARAVETWLARLKEKASIEVLLGPEAFLAPEKETVP